MLSSALRSFREAMTSFVRSVLVGAKRKSRYRGPVKFFAEKERSLSCETCPFFV